MHERMLTLIALSLLLAAPLTACGGAPGGDAPSAETALQVTGNVEDAMAWTEEEVRSKDTVDAQRENKDGEMSTYTGVPVSALLEEAGVPDDATTVTFVAEDDYAAEAELSDIMACGDCIVSFRNQGGFSIVMPGYSGKLQVKGVVEIRVE